MIGNVPRMTRKRAKTVRNPAFPSIPQENVIGGRVFRGAIFKLAPRIVVFLVNEIIFRGAISKIAPGFVFPLTWKIVFRGAISEIAPENLRPLIRNVRFLVRILSFRGAILKIAPRFSPVLSIKTPPPIGVFRDLSRFPLPLHQGGRFLIC